MFWVLAASLATISASLWKGTQGVGRDVGSKQDAVMVLLQSPTFLAGAGT